ncbi:MAG: peptidoglycan-binding protein [Actinomycetota bacterium]|nr:peptidoglycan-binding protein [Actinomycetota bacterium]
MSDDAELAPLSDEELAAEEAIALPDKEVVSILDLNADLDLAIDAAAPIDLAVAANANIAAPIDAAVGANILSDGSSAQALADQGVLLNQNIAADATANATQDSVIDQSNDVVDDGTGATTDATAGTTGDGTSTGDTSTGGTTTADTGALPDAGDLPDADVGPLPTDPEAALDGDLLNVDVNLAADADVAAPVDGAVAANANVAAPIDAAVAANVGSADSQAVAVAQQDAIINQNIEGAATANADQQSDITQ